MADKKISQLTAVSTPLAGTEELPAVQSSTTKKVTVAQLQAAPVVAGTANTLQYLNGSKVPSTSSNLTFDGTNLSVVGSGCSATVADYKPNMTASRSVVKVTTGGTYGNVIGSTVEKYLDVSFEGFANQELARIRSWDESNVQTRGTLTFWTGTGGTLSQQMQIAPSGGVSIGNTTDPGATNLSVTGSISSGPRAITKASMPAGTVLQVVQATYSTSTTNLTTSYVDTGLSASITPSSSTSKILVLVCQNTNIASQIVSTNGYVNIVRNSTQIHEANLGIRAAVSSNTYLTSTQTVSMSYLDSPTTTSAVTYKTQAKCDGTTNAGITTQSGSIPSTITLLEIAA